MLNLNHPPVSIGISFYNAESTLLDAIRSIFSQSYQNWELILVDDGSTDHSLEIAKSIDDPRIRVYSDGKNLRLAARLNQITKLAKYDFIMRMDADDLISPVRLEKQLNLLLTQPDIDLVATGICSLNDEYEPMGIRCVAENHTITASRLLSGSAGIPHASIMGRRVWFERNPYKESMIKSQDTNLWVRSYSKNDLSIAFLREPLYYYREDGNITKQKLLQAYAMGRHTIIYDAKDKFNFPLKSKVFIKNLFKTVIIKYFSKFGILQFLRNRRNVKPLDENKKLKLTEEIEMTRQFKLPIISRL